MTSSNKLFRTKSPKFEEEYEEELHKPKKKSKKKFDKSLAEKSEPSEYTVVSSGGVHHISPKAMQRLRMMGCSEEYVGDLMHTVNVLQNFSNRTVDPPIFEDIKKRYHLGMGTMASLASMSNLRLSDMGIDLRGLARFYSRNRSDIRDVEELERFVDWIKSRGESVKGVPSAWYHYRSLHGSRRKRRPAVRRRPSRKRSRKAAKKQPKRKSKKKSKAKRRKR